jgi:hypothetical protein
LFCVIIQFPESTGYPVTAREMTDKEKGRYRQMEEQMNDKLPQTDSIQELAKFWDRHDLTDFEDELEEVRDPVFDRATVVKLHLSSNKTKAVEEIAGTRGLDPADLIHEGVAEKSQRAWLFRT